LVGKNGASESDRLQRILLDHSAIVIDEHQDRLGHASPSS